MSAMTTSPRSGSLPRRTGAHASFPSVIVIPALEPGPELVELVSALRAEGTEVLVVDDGSGPDWSALFDRCVDAGARVHHESLNRGKGAALRRAFRLVHDRFPDHGVVTADADGQHTVEDIRRVQEALAGVERSRADALVLGVRDFSLPEVPARSRLGNAVSSAMLALVAGVRLGDTQTGLRGIPASRLEWARMVPGDRYEYEFSMLRQAACDGLPLTSVPIATVYLDENATSHFRPVRDSLRVLGPVVAFSLSGLASCAVDTAMFLGLHAVGMPLWAALVLARVISGSANFLLNRRVVFDKEGRAPLGRAAGRYGLLAAAMLAGGVLLVDASVALGASPLWAKLGTDVVLFGLSFAVQRLVVFRAR
ncbi:hypothetical protein GCM10009591_19570 [Brachybacterium tyrofermentans]